MSMSHHGDSETMRRFLDQMDGKAKREYPKGRMGHEDDGALAFAIAADRVHNTVVIRFGKPVEWIGLGPQDVQNMIDSLQARLLELSVGVH